MMYCEFIERTHFGEKYITETMYHKYIEPAYMAAPDDINKNQFCKDFYKLHKQAVSNIVSGLIRAKSTADKERYINSGNNFKDIETKHGILLNIFLESLTGLFKEYYGT